MSSRSTLVRSIVCLACALVAASYCPAQRVGTGALGRLDEPHSFDLMAEADRIRYDLDLDTWSYTIREPAGFSHDSRDRYGLYVFVPPGEMPGEVAAPDRTLDTRRLFYLGCNNVNNNVDTDVRMGAALLGAFRMQQRYPNIDPQRVYFGGRSGGARVVSRLAELRPDVVRGVVCQVGATLPTAIPGWQCAGKGYGTSDDNYEVSINDTAPRYRLFPTSPRFALVTTYDDWRRTELVAIYRYGHMNHGNNVRLIVRPGHHNTYHPESIDEAIRFLDQPLGEAVCDRFEDGDLSVNVATDGPAAVGSGFVDASAAGAKASESTTEVNGLPSRVLRLVAGPDGAAAAVVGQDTFEWNNADGAIIDVRLRAETNAGLNQRLGVHVVRSDADGPTAQRPGFHVTYGYGEKCSAIFVDGNGRRWPLATWRFDGPHPMELAGTDKLFWDFTTAPDHAGAAVRFRGDDLRLVLNDSSFQLTFSRPVADVSTDYVGDAVVAFPVSRGVAPGDGEHHPLVIQGYWSNLQLQGAVARLGNSPFVLGLSNEAVDTAQPAGAALFDEVRVQARGGSVASSSVMSDDEILINIHPAK